MTHGSIASTLSSTYRPDIDGLRAVAIVPVLLHHLGLGPAGGFAGVDVFFVISGWLICGRIIAEIRAGTFSIRQFWIRRLRRLYPAMFVVLIATLACGALLAHPVLYTEIAWSAIAQAALVANYYFWSHTDYFAPHAATMPLLHMWSLAVEEQFYLLIPFLMRVIGDRTPALLHRSIWILALGSFVLSVSATQVDPRGGYFLLQNRVWELLTGALVGLAPRLHCRKKAGTAYRCETAAFCGLASILATYCLASDGSGFPGLAALPVVLGTAAVIWGNGDSAKPTAVSRLLSLKPLVAIGLISYSLYLWHWPVIVYMKLGWPAMDKTLFNAVAVGLSFLLGVGSWLWVEQPFRGKLIRPTDRELIAMVVCGTLLTVSAAGIVVATKGWPQRLPEKTRRLLEVEELASHYHGANQTGNFHSLPRLGDRSSLPSEWRLLLWGDSHAEVLVSLLDDLATEHGVRGVAACSSGQPPVINAWTAGTKFRVTQIHPQIVDLVLHSGITDVVLVGRWSVYADKLVYHCDSRNGKGDEAAQPSKGYDGLLRALKDTVTSLQNAGARVWILKQVPEQAEDVRQTLFARPNVRQGITLDRYTSVNQAMEQGLVELESIGCRTLDPVPFMFDDQGISVLVVDGVAAYVDDNHLSPAAAKKLLAPLFAPVFQGMARDKR